MGKGYSQDVSRRLKRPSRLVCLHCGVKRGYTLVRVLAMQSQPGGDGPDSSRGGMRMERGRRARKGQCLRLEPT